MKVKFIFIVILSVLFTSVLMSQQRAFPYNVSHPSIFYAFARPSLNIDTAFIYNIKLEEPIPYEKYYSRSADMLTDTLRNIGSETAYIFRYNEKNQLLYDHAMPRQMWGRNGYLRTDYEYDEEGRIVRYEMNWIDVSTNTKTFQGEKNWDYSSIQKTEKGFIFNGVECELDEQGRITLIKYKTPFDKFVELDGKQYRVNDEYYTYTDSSYTSFGCFPVFDRPHEFEESPLQWMKSTGIYNENGDLKAEYMVYSDDGINWKLANHFQTEYAYSNSQTHSAGDVSNFNVNKTNTLVYAQTGAIQIVTENSATVQIFDIAGRKVKQQALAAGENRISLSSGGFYFVKIGNESFKVFVR